MKSLRQSGMGLVEVMVAAAMLGGLSLVVMQLTENSQKGVVRMERGMEAAEVDGEINSLIAGKDNCTLTMNSLGAPVTIASMTGSSRYPTTGSLVVRALDPDGVTVKTIFTAMDKRNLLTFQEAYFTDYVTVGSTGKPPGTASLVKRYTFLLGPGKVATKVKSARVSITPDSTTPANAAECVLSSADSDSIWHLAAYGIWYDDGTVTVGKESGTVDIPLAMDVLGQVVMGFNNSINYPVAPTTTANLLSNSVLGGLSNLIEGSASSQGTIVGGTSNTLSSGRGTLVGGTSNIIVGGADSVLVGGELNSLNGYRNFLAGGKSNNLSSANVDGGNAIISGTSNQITSGSYNAIISGTSNVNAAAGGSAIISGTGNQITLGSYNAIISGTSNVNGAAGGSAVVLGGNANTVSGPNSIVGGVSSTASGLNSVSITATGSASGDYSTVIGGNNNSVAALSSAIIGGEYSSISAGGTRSVIIGGGMTGQAQSISNYMSAIIAGSSNTVTGNRGAIVAGSSNNISSAGNFIGGGQSNTASNVYAIVVGGTTNTASGQRSAVIGGSGNTASIDNSAVIGGSGNVATGGLGPVVFGGRNNRAGTDFAAVLGGDANTASGASSVAIGGTSNDISSAGTDSATIGGLNNSITNYGSVILGGASNAVSGLRAAVLAGQSNSAGGQYAVVIGGNENYATAVQSTTVGGYNNQATFQMATTIGGQGNRATNLGSLAGGLNSLSSGQYSTALGYQNTASANWTFAFGTNATASANYAIALGKSQALHSGSLVMSDVASAHGTSTASDQLTARYSGGIRMFTNDLSTTGLQMSGGGSAWIGVSDRNAKEDFRDIDEEEILSKMPMLDLPSWVYKDQTDKTKRTIGPMAQDFYRLFAKPYELESGEKTLSQADVTGVALVSIKALEKRTSDLQKENEELKEEMAIMRAQMNELMRRMDQK